MTQPTSRLPRVRAVEEVSAGGLVVDAVKGEAFIAVIARRSRAGRLEWCLPKGHVEPGETPARAAVREIQEETGIEGQVLRHLGTIDYWFSGGRRRVHKTVHHYLLSAIGGCLSPAGDPDAEAVDARWVPLSDLRTWLVYPNERRLAAVATSVLRGEE
ncbi:MAG: NUDIX hydrolase [Bifidobacteriaceae bacterium]|nr:NUDIX hydrolase [Bifidobacteriaceae bacterium]